MKKILFLDIDGVMNRPERGSIKPERELIDRLNIVIAKTGASLVLSSVWRLGKKMRRELQDAGIKFVAITPELRGKPRGEEIAAFLKHHPKNKRYAILDDDSDMLPEQLPSFFRCDPAEGLTQEIADKVVEHLNSTEPIASPITRDSLDMDFGIYEPLKKIIIGNDKKPRPEQIELLKAMVRLVKDTGDQVAEQAYDIGRTHLLTRVRGEIRLARLNATLKPGLRVWLARKLAPRDILFVKQTKNLATILYGESEHQAQEHGPTQNKKE